VSTFLRVDRRTKYLQVGNIQFFSLIGVSGSTWKIVANFPNMTITVVEGLEQAEAEAALIRLLQLTSLGTKGTQIIEWSGSEFDSRDVWKISALPGP
jgi:hypothetical protein